MTTHSFEIEDAEKYGILAAVLLNHIRFWVKKNQANRKHFYDGQYWTYNSVSAFSELFPYATKDQIRRALEKLEEEGAIKTGCYNSNPYDRTKWFSCNVDLANLPNQFANDAKSLTNTDIKPDIKQAASADADADFMMAWNAYPKRPGANRAQTFKAWKARRKEGIEAERMIKGAQAYAAYCKTNQTEPQYIKQPQTFFGIGQHFDSEWLTTENKAAPAAYKYKEL